MSVFKRNYEDESLFSSVSDKSNWMQVFSACLGRMIAVQNAFGELAVKGQRWNVDFSRGLISFGSDIYHFQFIGSESTSGNTWMWGWQNINGFKDSILTAANETKEIGEKWGLEPLCTPKFAMNDTYNGHFISTVMCMLLGHYCYYRCPHQAGAAYVAISGVSSEVFAPVDVSKFATVTMQCIQKFPVDHKIFAESFLRFNRTKFEFNNNKLTAHFAKDLLIEFEKVNDILRISSMKTK